MFVPIIFPSHCAYVSYSIKKIFKILILNNSRKILISLLQIWSSFFLVDLVFWAYF